MVDVGVDAGFHKAFFGCSGQHLHTNQHTCPLMAASVSPGASHRVRGVAEASCNTSVKALTQHKVSVSSQRCVVFIFTTPMQLFHGADWSTVHLYAVGF